MKNRLLKRGLLSKNTIMIKIASANADENEGRFIRILTERAAYTRKIWESFYF